MGEHPHQGVIEAVAHLSDSYAKALCTEQALIDNDVSYEGSVVDDGLRQLSASFLRLADALMEPFGVADVLQTVEETIADGPSVPDLGAPESIRFQIVMAIVDAALAARQEERGDDDCPCGEPGCGEAPGLGIEVDPADRQRAADALCAIGRVLVEPGECPDTGHARILVEGHDFDEELVRQTLQLAEGGPVAVLPEGHTHAMPVALTDEMIEIAAHALADEEGETSWRQMAETALRAGLKRAGRGERTHILVPREALAWASATAKDLAAMQRETEPGADPADYLKGHSPADHEAWAETFAAAERGEHVEWPDRDTQEGR
jgi:hypothetical protein